MNATSSKYIATIIGSAGQRSVAEFDKLTDAMQLCGKLQSGERSEIHFRGELGIVEIHREFITAAARWIFAAKLWSVLSARMAMRLNSLSLQKKFSIR